MTPQAGHTTISLLNYLFSGLIDGHYLFGGTHTLALPIVPPRHTFDSKYNFKPIEDNMFEAKMTNFFH